MKKLIVLVVLMFCCLLSAIPLQFNTWGKIDSKSVDQPIDGQAYNGLDGAWKRANLDTLILGESNFEGFIWRITTGGINTVQTMDLHLKYRSEELTF